MDGFIRDGRGKGKLAGVDEDNRLTVSAFTQTEMGFHSKEYASAFGCYARASAVAANTNEGLLYFSNAGTTDLVIKYFTFSVGMPTGGDLAVNYSAK